eukprot:3038273-Amphidinium_carterae.1
MLKSAQAASAGSTLEVKSEHAAASVDTALPVDGERPVDLFEAELESEVQELINEGLLNELG